MARSHIGRAVLGVGVVMVMLAVLALQACQSPPTPAPDNGVSNASYRLVVTQSVTNTALITAKLQTAEEQDLAGPSPVHSREWWEALIGLSRDTNHLLVATLQGSTYYAPAPATTTSAPAGR